MALSSNFLMLTKVVTLIQPYKYDMVRIISGEPITAMIRHLRSIDLSERNEQIN